MNSVSSEIQEFKYDNGDVQKVQIVRFESLNDLDFFQPVYDDASFDKLVNLYNEFIIKKYALVFGKVIIFRLQESIDVPFSSYDDNEGQIFDKQAIVTLNFKRNIKVKNGKLCFKDEVTKNFFDYLMQKGDLFVASGKRDTLSVLPVGKQLGFISSCDNNDCLRVNANFFVMDQLDCGSIYDKVGSPIGLVVKNGKILNPPLFDREVLVSKSNGTVEIMKININQLKIKIDNKEYVNGLNCKIYQRPKNKYSSSKGTNIVIANNNVVAINKNRKTIVPSSGFVINTNEIVEKIDDLKVSYKGLEMIDFAIQVGNSVVVNGKITKKFVSPFYSFFNIFATSFPPSMYPLNFKKDRAPRIVLGTDKDNKGMLLWFEGAGKFGYQPKVDSCGASLLEVGIISESLGMFNGINLDGGGSAQIVIENKRYLKISDRNSIDYSQQERAIPMGIVIR